MHLYANGIYACDERYAMNLVSWIEKFIFRKGYNETNEMMYNIFDK